jgi:hypothetical protein
MAVMFGGGDPVRARAGAERHRDPPQPHVHPPLSWQGKWQVKNLVELKAGQRVLMEGNVFENNWASAQVGFAFVWWSANADGNALWSVTQDVTFRYNRVTNVAQGSTWSTATTHRCRRCGA